MTTSAGFGFWLDHVQLAIPRHGEAQARDFYVGVLGLIEVEKPAVLAGRGGLWLQGGGLDLHLGVDDDFRPARKAHPGIGVRGLDTLRARLEAVGAPVIPDDPVNGNRRFHSADPFGNRLEFLEPLDADEPSR